jgi:hypothetical protein
MRDIIHRDGRENGVTALTIDGSKRTIAEWSEISGLARSTILGRLQRGFGIKGSVFVPRDKPYYNSMPLNLSPAGAKRVPLTEIQRRKEKTRRKLDAALAKIEDKREAAEVWE